MAFLYTEKYNCITKTVLKQDISSDLYTCGAFCLGDENKGTITGKNVPYVSSRILNMVILGCKL